MPSTSLAAGVLMERRDAVCAVAFALLGLGLPSRGFAQFQPFALRLVRRTGFAELMGKNQCVISDIYQSDPTFPISDRGTKLCNGLELAYRNNLSDISAIPEGEYPGSVLTDGALGWRIALTGTGPRKDIRIHVGNSPVNTQGCILPGTGDTTDTRCFISGSKEALQKIQAAYGSSTARPVVLLVQS
jgi:hypothetical protein